MSFPGHSGADCREICQSHLLCLLIFIHSFLLFFSCPLQSPPPAFSFPTTGNSSDQLAWGLQWPACLPSPGNWEKRHRGQLLEAVKRDNLQVVLRARLQVARPDFCLGKIWTRTRVPGEADAPIQKLAGTHSCSGPWILQLSRSNFLEKIKGFLVLNWWPLSFLASYGLSCVSSCLPT